MIQLTEALQGRVIIAGQPYQSGLLKVRYGLDGTVTVQDPFETVLERVSWAQFVNPSTGLPFDSLQNLKAFVESNFFRVRSGGPTPEADAILDYLWTANAGITNIAGSVDVMVEQKGTGKNFIAPTALVRPPYRATGGLNGKPYLEFANAHSLYVPFLDLSSYRDITVFTVFEHNIASIGIIYEHTQNSNFSTGGFVLVQNEGFPITALMGEGAAPHKATADFTTGIIQANYYKSLPTNSVAVAGLGVSNPVQTNGSVLLHNFLGADFFLGARNGGVAPGAFKFYAQAIVLRQTSPSENTQILDYFKNQYAL